MGPASISDARFRACRYLKDLRRVPPVKHLLLFVLLFCAGIAARAQYYPQYHDISDTAAAQLEAQQRHLPIAYLGAIPADLTRPTTGWGTQVDLTKLAMATLQGRAVVILFNGLNMAPVPALIHGQYHIQDDGANLGNNISWLIPKIVFADPGITKVLGRVSHTQMEANRQDVILQALAQIQNDPTALSPVIPPPPPLAVSTKSVDGYPLYHAISDTAAAQTEARKRNLPLAYLGAYDGDLTTASPAPNSDQDLTQMALAALSGKAVIIFFDGKNMAPVPAIVHAQYHVHDDGELSGGASWLVPKVVFADPGITKTLGRVSATQMKGSRDVLIISALESIHADPTSLTAAAPPTPAPTPVPQTIAGIPIDKQAMVDFVMAHQLYCGIGLVAFLLLVTIRMGRRFLR